MLAQNLRGTLSQSAIDQRFVLRDHHHGNNVTPKHLKLIGANHVSHIDSVELAISDSAFHGGGRKVALQQINRVVRQDDESVTAVLSRMFLSRRDISKIAIGNEFNLRWWHTDQRGSRAMVLGISNCAAHAPSVNAIPTANKALIGAFKIAKAFRSIEQSDRAGNASRELGYAVHPAVIGFVVMHDRRFGDFEFATAGHHDRFLLPRVSEFALVT